MRKYWKIVLYSAIGVLTVICAVVSLIHETGDRVAVNIRIESIEKNFFDKRESISKVENGLTVKDALAYVESKYDSIKIEDSDGVITGINGDENGSFGGTDGWNIRVNGQNVTDPIDKIGLKSEDSLTLFYGDPAGAGMQYPTLDTSKIKEGVIRVVQRDTTVGDDGKEQVKETPVNGAAFSWTYGSGKAVSLVTDKDGFVTLTDERLVAGKHTVTLSRADKRGMPTLLRLEPDTVIKTSDKLEVGKGSFIEAYSDQLLIITGLATLAVAVLGVLYAGARNKIQRKAG